MPFDNNTNATRVRNICILLDYMAKSAASNKATSAETQALLAPVIDKLRALDAIATTPEPAPMDQPAATFDVKLTAGQRMAVKLAGQISTRDMIAGLLSRLETYAIDLPQATELPDE